MNQEIYIYGAGSRGKELFENIQTFYEDKVFIKGFIDREKKGFVCGLQVYEIAAVSKDDIIVISIAKFESALQVAIDLKKFGFQNVFWYNLKNIRKKREDFCFSLFLFLITDVTIKSKMPIYKKI